MRWNNPLKLCECSLYPCYPSMNIHLPVEIQYLRKVTVMAERLDSTSTFILIPNWQGSIWG